MQIRRLSQRKWEDAASEGLTLCKNAETLKDSVTDLSYLT